MSGTVLGAVGPTVVSAALEPVTGPDNSPKTGSRVDLMPIPAADVSVRGDEFAVAVDPADVPASHMTRTGIVTVTLEIVDAETGAVGDLVASARAVTATDSRERSASSTDVRWADPLAAVDVTPGQRVPLLVVTGEATRAHSTSTAADLAPLESQRVELRRVPGAAERIEAVTAASSSHVRASNALCRWGDRTRVWATIGTSYPVNLATLRYSSSTASSFGVAYKRGDTWTQEATKSTEDSWGQQVNKSGRNRSYQTQVVYRRQNCQYAHSGRSYSKSMPEYQAGYTRVNLLGPKAPNFTHCGPVYRGEWWRGSTRGTDYQLSYGVKSKHLIGFDLSSRRAYSSEGRLSYYYRQPRTMCGSNADAGLARTVRERR